jgi:carbonic anhydrase
VNNGHTLQINARPGSFLRVSNDDFQLRQMHFHSPSEHRVDRETFPLEAHFVHENDQGELAVVGVLFRAGTWNSDLEKIGQAAPRAIGQSEAIDLEFRELGLFANPDSYFRYSGSLTTPPCTEGVRWYVLKATGALSTIQVENFVELIGEDARGPQPLNARVVLEH